ncbi:excinuclease ABC subunit UvrA [Paenibacillus sp. GSMTC-2017]|uniref:excinuclease ABC subunit UvrA n=1 Tax=Paenibacillus sp. GSMTC-2017 TaxID=2794350 RepID=UPI0018D81C6B|nr:excinuclease ABC subunit UvrA [Paenibacillus sp. GSMTC-2017]MBH5318286.1 excinuclease ABC subunit UvrA [Paenibacillus sp. GSMTC-2017]
MYGTIKIRGARENNLKNISLEIPKHKLVVVTGPSGSGKSTLALDTLQRECQRQYMESMGMVSEEVSKPKVDSIEGLSPSISVGQHVTNRNPRSTIGTASDIYTLMRILYAKLGERPCPACGEIVKPVIGGQPSAKLVSDEEDGTGFNQKVHCESCGHSLEKLTMSHFSFNKPEGACQECSGLGHVASLDIESIFDKEKNVRDGGVRSWQGMYTEYNITILKAASQYYGLTFDEEAPLKSYDTAMLDLLYYGAESEVFVAHFPNKKPPKAVTQGKFEGVITGIWRRYNEKGGDSSEGSLFKQSICNSCNGAKLRKESLLVKVNGLAIQDASSRPLGVTLESLEQLKAQFTEDEEMLVGPIVYDMIVRLKRIIHAGLSYMSLERPIITLSGGEAQRLRLASILGSGLTGVLYILDEPTAGLHPRDTSGLIQVLKQLRDLGNTVLVIEHDEEVMRAADHIIDIGPGAGIFGGEVVGQGSLEELINQPSSVTGNIFRDKQVSLKSSSRRKGNGNQLTVHDAHLRNLKGVTAAFPLGCLVSVTGVSGSGKSTLLFDLLADSGPGNDRPSGCERITGWEDAGPVIMVDQSPLSRMQRSNIATYTDVYTHLRNWYAGFPEAKAAGLTAKHFSFNTQGGRCEECQGLGVVSVHMHFLQDIEVRCPACRGRRFKEEVLAVTYEGYSITDLLDMSIQESMSLLEGQKKINDTLKLLSEVGLGYLKWGQSLNTLSGGEGQRIKLAKQLSKKTTQHTLYLLDEPSTGLHPGDVRKLEILLNKLVDAGNTVIIVEHNINMIANSDWVIDIGPEGGGNGGYIVAEGTPETVAQVEASYTGQFLKPLLQ